MTSNNLEAAEEIVRQLRLRDIGGIIVIDFIDMVLPSNRELLLRRLVECLGRDRTRHQVAEVTSLGLVQMTRKKIGTGLLEAFSTECPHCHGRGLRDARHAGRDPEAARRRRPGHRGRATAVGGGGAQAVRGRGNERGRVRAGSPSGAGRRRRPAEPAGRAGRRRDGRARSAEARIPAWLARMAARSCPRCVVAIVGAGPSGIYAAEALTQQAEVDVQVVVLDRLPVPFGLVRYGVAPDHAVDPLHPQHLGAHAGEVRGALLRRRDHRSRPERRGAARARRRGDLRLRRRHRQAAGDPRRGPGRAASRPPEFVAWYCGHPDVHPDTDRADRR